MSSAPKERQSAAIMLDAARSTHAHTGNQVVRRLLRPTNRLSEWQGIAQSWAPVRTVTFNLAKYLTAWVPSVNAEGPLILRCITQALDSWHGAGAAASERDRYHAYLRGLLYPLPEALEWRVFIPTDEEAGCWNPLESGLLQWWRAAGGLPAATRRIRPADSIFVDVAPADFRFIVLIQFLLNGTYTVTPLVGRLEHLVSRFG